MAANFLSADRLLFSSRQYLVDGQPILVSTFVNIDNLEQSSSFGRVISEQISSRLSVKNVQILEPKLRNHTYMKPDVGELMLTRRISDVPQFNEVQAILVGTYYVGTKDVIVNLKLVKPETNIVIGSDNFVIPLSDYIGDLLGIKPKIIERLPSIIRVTGDNCGGFECNAR